MGTQYQPKPQTHNIRKTRNRQNRNAPPCHPSLSPVGGEDVRSSSGRWSRSAQPREPFRMPGPGYWLEPHPWGCLEHPWSLRSGTLQAEEPCYLSSTDLSLPYPYCCPRSICPARLDVHTNLIDTDDYEDELQMAAATWDDASQVRVAPPTEFVVPHQTEGEENQDQENVILAYDTADDYSDSGLSDSSDDFTAIDDYPDVQIDWSAWISAMPSPVLID